MRPWQECACLECGTEFEAPVRNGKANYWWEGYNSTFEIRHGLVVRQEAT
jgi:hypothetical protein